MLCRRAFALYHVVCWVVCWTCWAVITFFHVSLNFVLIYKARITSQKPIQNTGNIHPSSSIFRKVILFWCVHCAPIFLVLRRNVQFAFRWMSNRRWEQLFASQDSDFNLGLTWPSSIAKSDLLHEGCSVSPRLAETTPGRNLGVFVSSQQPGPQNRWGGGFSSPPSLHLYLPPFLLPNIQRSAFFFLFFTVTHSHFHRLEALSAPREYSLGEEKPLDHFLTGN